MKYKIILLALIITFLMSSCIFLDNPYFDDPPKEKTTIEPFKISLIPENPIRQQEVLIKLNRSLKNDESVTWYYNEISIGSLPELLWSFDSGTSVLEARITKNNIDVLANNLDIVIPHSNSSYKIEESFINVYLKNNIPTINFTVYICLRFSDRPQICSEEAKEVSLEIENINNEKIEVPLQNDEYFPARWSKEVDSQTFKEQTYKVHVRIIDGDNKIFRINNFETFSGEHYRTCTNDLDCKLYMNNINFHSCEENICVLKNSTYKVGVVYVHSSLDNYNANWKTDLQPVFERTKAYIGKVTDYRIEFDYELLDSYKTDLFCWNPYVLGLEVAYSPNIYSPETLRNMHYETPASVFYFAGKIHFVAKNYTLLETCTNCIVEKIEKTTIENGPNDCTIFDETVSSGTCFEKYKPNICNGKTGEQVFDCSLCGCEEPYLCDSYSGECVIEGHTPYTVRSLCPEEKLLTKDNFLNNKDDLRENINLELNLNNQEYDDIILIFGRLGTLRPESDLDIYQLCYSNNVFIGGFSSLEFPENGLYHPYIVDCSKFKYSSTGISGYYISGGGHKTIIHEILHRFGALDIYQWHGFLQGLYSTEYARKVASEIDTDFNMSIMGDKEVPCMNGSERFNSAPDCDMDELNDVYLDVFNQRQIGIIVPENR